MTIPKLSAPNTNLLGLLLVYLALAATYSFVTPLGEGPDEPGHAAYVFFVARNQRLPDQLQNEVPGEGHQPPLTYVLAAPTLLWLPQDERRLDLPGNGRFVWAGGDQPNAVAHGNSEFWPWRGAVLGWHLARLVSVACGAATVGLTFLAARALAQSWPTAQPLLPLLAATLVAFNPQFLFTSALVTNDALLATLSALVLWLAIRQPLRQTIPQAAGLGLALGLALLTKQSAVVLLPVALLEPARATLQALRRRDGPAVRRALTFATVVLAVAGLVAGWWYVRNWQLYGDPLGLSVFQGEFATQRFELTNLEAWAGALRQLHDSFWARFGWMNVPPPGWVAGLFGAIELLALLGLGYELARGRPSTRDERPGTNDQGRATKDHGEGERGRGGDERARTNRASLAPSSSLPAAGSQTLAPRRWLPLVAVALLVATTFAWVVSFALAAGLVAWQGRLLFPALPGVATLLAIGLGAWGSLGIRNGQSTRRRSFFFQNLPLLVAGVMLLVAVWLPFGVIRPAYPAQTLPETTALERLGTPLYGRFAPLGEQGAALRGWNVSGEAQPGATLELRLIWQALARQSRSWAVFVHLVDTQEQIVAESNSFPRNGLFPTTQWDAGDWVEDTHALELPASLQPGSYTLRVGLFDQGGTQERTGVYSQEGDLVGDYLDLATITVQPAASR